MSKASKNSTRRRDRQATGRTPAWLRATGRWASRVLLVLAGLLILILAALQLPFVKGWIVEIVEAKLSERFPANFEIGELGGSLLGDATLRGFAIPNVEGAREPYFITIDEVEVRFNLLEVVFGNPRLRLAEVSGVRVNLETFADGSINVQYLFPRPEEIPEGVVAFDTVRLIGGEVRYDTFDDRGFSIADLHARMSLELDSGWVMMTGLNLHGSLPDFNIPGFWTEGGVTVNRDGLVDFDGLRLATLGSLVHLNGHLLPGAVELEFLAANVSLDEVRRAVDPELPLAGGVELQGRLSGPFEDLRGEMTVALRNPNLAGFLLDELVMDGSYAEGRLLLDNFRLRRGQGRVGGWAALDLSGPQPTVDCRLSFYGINPAALDPVGAAGLPGDLNGRLRLDWKGEEQGYYGELELYPGSLAGMPIRGVKLAGYGEPHSFRLTEGTLRLAGGRFNLSGGLEGEQLALRLSGREISLEDLALLAGHPGPRGGLEVDAQIGGTLRAPRIQYALRLSQVRYAEASIDDLRVAGRLQLPWDRGGSLDLELDGRGLLYDDYSVERFRFAGLLDLEPAPRVQGNLTVQQITVGELELESLEIAGAYADERLAITNLALVVDPRTRLHYAGGIDFHPDGVALDAEELLVHHGELELWTTEPLALVWRDSDLEVSPVELASQAGRLRLELDYRPALGEIALQLDATELDLGELERRTALTGLELEGGGRLHLLLNGRIEAPRVELEGAFSGLRLGDNAVDSLVIRAELGGEQDLLELVEALSGRQPLPGVGDTITGRLGVRAVGPSSGDYRAEYFDLYCELTERELRLERMVLELGGANIDAAGRLDLTTTERYVELALGAYDFPLDDLPLLPEEIRLVGGSLVAQGSLRGPLESPLIHGGLIVRADALHLDDQNITATDVLVVLDADTKRIVVEELSLDMGRGSLSGAGQLEYSTGVLEGELRLDGRELRLRNAADIFSGSCDLEVTITVEPGRTRIAGLVLINEGEVELPLGGEPSLRPGRRPPADVEQAALELDLRIVAERNLWVRSEMTDLEVSADVRMTLAGNELVLGGSLETIRGNVWFLDKGFELDRGSISFGRRVPPDPDLNIEASTILRGRRRDAVGGETRVIIRIGGHLSAPTLNLSSVPELPEGDIIMLIALDMTWAEYQQLMGERGAGGLAGHAGGQAAMMLAGFIQNKLRRMAREATGLDTLKLEGALDTGGELERVDLTVGKYLFRDLYVSYSRDVLSRGNQSLWVEYFISDNLSAVGSTREEEGQMTYRLNLKWKLKY